MKLSKTPVLFLLAIALIAPAIAWAQDPVTFPDAALEAVVREALGIPTEPIMSHPVVIIGSGLAGSHWPW